MEKQSWREQMQIALLLEDDKRKKFKLDAKACIRCYSVTTGIEVRTLKG